MLAWIKWLVTGGSRGIGAAVVRGAISQGYSVSFSYSRDAENANALASELRGSGHRVQALKAATTPDPDERLAAVRALLAEEARMGLMVGVAVGWALKEEMAALDAGRPQGIADTKRDGES